MQFSDVHVGNEANRPVHQRLVAAVDLVSERKPAFVIDTGDLTAHPVYGPEPEYLAEFDEYRRYTDDLTVPLYVVPGNHDIGYSHPIHPRSTGEPWGDYTQLVAVFREKIGPLDQSFEREGVRFVLLNNNPRRSGEPGHLSAAQLAWTEGELKHGQPTFIFCHVEVLEHGTGAPWGDSSQALSDLCRTYGVIAVAYGHRHELHVTERKGTVYIMCPDLKVKGHRGVLEYRVCADHFELWHVDVCARTETRLAHHHYGP
jgi:3',5'-cyclic AMP phosphodiesterase CpdA